MEEEDISHVESQVHSPVHVLPLCTRLAYSVGHVLNDLCASMWFTYLLIYQHSVLQFSNNIAGNLMLLGQIADAISTPFVGLESDRQDDFWLCRYGQRKTWHLVGTLCVIISFPFLFMECVGCGKSSEYAQFLYYGVFIVIFQFGWASTQISHLSLIPELTPVSSERVELNALRYAMTVMSTICVYVSMWGVLGINSKSEDHISPQDSLAFKEVALPIVGIGAVFSVIFHLFVKVKPQQQNVCSDPSKYSINQFMDMSHDVRQLRWKDWFKQRQFYQVALLYMATRLYVNLSQVYMPLFIQDTLYLSKEKIAVIPLVIYVSGFSASFLMKPLKKRFGNKVTYFSGCILGLIAAVWLFVRSSSVTFRTYEIYAVGSIIGIAGSTMLIISLSIVSDLIGNSTTSGAFVFGAFSFLDKLSNGVAIVIIQDAHPCKYCCSHCQWYYQYVLVFACGGSIILGLVALLMLSSQTIGVRKQSDVAPKNRVPGIMRNSSQSSESLRPKYLEHCSDDDTTPLLRDDDMS